MTGEKAEVLPPHRTFSIGRVRAIVWATVTELVRLKVFYVLLLFALIIIGNSAFVPFVLRFSPAEEFQLLKDVALGAMTIFTSLLAIVATAMLIPKDMEDRTLYTILAKPVTRLEYLLGKLGGVLLLLAIATAVMSVIFFVVLIARQGWVEMQITRSMAEAPPEQVEAALKKVRESALNSNLIAGVLVIYTKAALLAALTLFVSTFASTSVFTIVVVVAVYFIGHLQGTARDYWLSSVDASWAAKLLLAVIALLFPDLQLFNLVDDIVAGNTVPVGLLMKTLGLGGLYVAVYTLVAYFVFSNREL